MYPAPLLSSLASITGSIILLKLYFSDRRVFRLLFMLQLIDMLVGQFLEFYASLNGWTTALYRVYYFSSPLSAALLALGVTALLGYKRLLKVFTVYTLIMAILLLYGVASAGIDVDALDRLGPFVGGMAMPDNVRILSPPITIPSGIIALVLAVIGYRRYGGLEYLGLVLGNLVFLVAGALLRAGHGELFLWLELVATVILAYSFIKAEARPGSI